MGKTLPALRFFFFPVTPRPCPLFNKSEHRLGFGPGAPLLHPEAEAEPSRALPGFHQHPERAHHLHGVPGTSSLILSFL